MSKPMGPRELALRAMREAKFEKKPASNPPPAAVMAQAVAAGAAVTERLKAKALAKQSGRKAGPAAKAAKPEEGRMATKAKKAKSKTKSKSKKAPKRARATGLREGSKLSIVVALMQRPEGCSTKEALKATGWPAISMPQQAKSAGVKLRKEKGDDGVFRYYVDAAPMAAAAE